MTGNKNRLSIRERIFKVIFVAGDRYKSVVRLLDDLSRFILVVSISLFLLGFVSYVGFVVSEQALKGIREAFRVLFAVIYLAKYIPELLATGKKLNPSLYFRAFIFILCTAVFIANFGSSEKATSIWAHFHGTVPVIIALFVMTISEMSELLRRISTIKIQPAMVFTIIFLLIIFIGTGFLMLPKAHFQPISFLDALFTSVSAVCVTGLEVTDTATSFTMLGQVIILILFQLGGLGIMTFTVFFSFIFTSSSSFRDGILLTELFSSESMGSFYKILTKIFLLTLLTEATGGLLIYGVLEHEVGNRVFFSAFHSVSAFCNAGFSTLPDGLATAGINRNGSLKILISILVILGGIGFPVLLFIYRYVRHLFLVLLRKIRRRQKPVRPEQRNISVRIVISTSVILLLTGMLLFWLFESNGSLSGETTKMKLVDSFFGSVSARSSGFNTMNISLWSYPTIFLMMLLMWIGASPGSTGGGIKTTTFFIAFRSAWSFVRGRESLRVNNREISNDTVRRVLTIIFFSLIFITAGFMGLMLTEPQKSPVHLLFETIAAYSTSGLSLADPSTFSPAGKLIVMLMMFIGRVGPLTLLAGIFAIQSKRYARYPEIDIVIN